MGVQQSCRCSGGGGLGHKQVLEDPAVLQRAVPMSRGGREHTEGIPKAGGAAGRKG